MIDHITFGVVDFERSTAFYDLALGSLGVRRLYDVPGDQSDGVKVAGYGDDTPWFWIAEERAVTGLMHIAFRAERRSQIDAFYNAAIAAGGTENGGPGLRPHYHPNYYAAFVLDPDGHNIEAVCHRSID